MEGPVRHPVQLHPHGLHPVSQLDLHLLLQEETTDQSEEKDQIHHPGQHGRTGASGAQAQIQHQTPQHRAQLQPDDVRVGAGQRPGHHLQPGPTRPQQEPDQQPGRPQRERLWVTGNRTPADTEGTSPYVDGT